MPYFDQCSTVWSYMCKNHILRLQRLQNRAMRIILRLDKRAHVDPMLKKLNLLSVNQRLEYNTCIMMYKILHNIAPNHLASNFILKRDRHCDSATTTRSMSKLDIQPEKAHKRSFKQRGSDTRNRLPQHLQSLTSIHAFKKELRKYIIVNTSPIL